ncbi:RagB/SusD family nutrient uptake outer membrane protein [Flavihumibacter sp. ZG627]|uniref:RagB/SusD family nutrient uptake outer membrane protein n=1 Tax=Flavihumibacter sp. ZG627 TaxID=1463156 RepID=UPI000A4C4C27|nr:RagB/SusD family nutrient uptake outer membrane protein [Flavihumibacter sp. ZG627]
MKTLQIAVISAMLMGSASCDKILDQEPQGSLDATTAFSTRQGVEAGLRGIYDALQSGSYYGLRYQAFADMGADNINHTGTFPSFAQIFNKQILADNVELSNMWNAIYNAINRANNIIASAELITDPAFNKSSAIGEARFLRALLYHDLLRYFGGSPNGYNKSGGVGVPLFTVPTLAPSDAAPKARATEAEVNQLIMDDLNFAIENLSGVSIARANVNAANALKARVELYNENFAAAEEAATAVIEKYEAAPLGGLADDYRSLWSKKNVTPESILELPFYVDDANSIAFFYFPGANGGRNEITSSPGLAAAHEANDKRKMVNVSVLDNTSDPRIPANKTLKAFRVAGDDNVILIRLAEVYLIRAEARARKASPDIAGAQSDLNVVRTRAGLPATTAATTAALVTAIENERRVELAHEGHRWFDLRRYNKIASLGITEPFRALWPIPLREVQTSAGVVEQNDGY